MQTHTPMLETNVLDINPNQHYIKIGQRLRAARLEQDLSIQTLSQRTWVSTNVIRSLETGDQSRWPEEIFLRSLVVRLATALDWTTIEQELPPTEITQTILPSWYDPDLEAAFKLDVEDDVSLQNYVRYLLIVTGLVSGFSWMTLHQMRTEAQSQTSRAVFVTPQCQAFCLPQPDATAAIPTGSDFIEWSDD
ncbi:MAG: helix-turn-helix transcriptional regulator [Cyanobacteria bacterium P01_G01_bin.54]